MSYKIFDADTVFGFYPKRNVDISLDALGKMMKKNNVCRIATISLQGVYYDFIAGNEETFAVTKNNPDWVPVCTIDPRRYYGCMEEILSRAEQGCRVIRLFPELQGWNFTALSLRNILKCIAETKMVLMLESRSWGLATQIVELSDQYNIPVIFTGISYWNLSEALAILKNTDSIYFVTQIFGSPDGIEIMVKEGGAARLIYGSHAPFDYMEPARLQVERARISKEQKEQIFYNNFQQLLRV